MYKSIYVLLALLFIVFTHTSAKDEIQTNKGTLTINPILHDNEALRPAIG